MTTPSRPKLRHRTIILPGNRGQHIETASRYLGISGEKFIELAILEHLQRTYAEMAEDVRQ